MTRTALLEIGFWGLPVPAFTAPLSALSQVCRDTLAADGLTFARVQSYCTGRRLAWLIEGLPAQSPARGVEIRGPKASLAYDFNGNPTQALYGFAADQGVEMNALFIRTVDNEQYLFVRKQATGMPIDKYLPALVEHLLSAVPWRDSPWTHNSRLPSPPAWVVLMADDTVIDCTIDGAASGRHTQAWTGIGFRPVELSHATSYLRTLEAAGIDPTLEQRNKVLSLRLMEALQAGETRQRDQKVIDRVVQRFESPTPRVFDLPAGFAELPEPVAATTLASIGEFLPVHLSKGGLAGRAIAFTEPADTLGDGQALWTTTFEQISRAVLRDWQVTANTPLSELVVRLMELPCPDNLGSMYERALRLSRLCRWLSAGYGGAVPEAKTDAACMMLFVERFTPLGRRFPDLSGVLISLVAEAQKIDPQVAVAVTEWWQAVRDENLLPASPLGQLLWAAELLDQTAQAIARDFEHRKWLPTAARLLETLAGTDWSGDVLTMPADLLGSYPFGRTGDSPPERCRNAFREGMHRALENVGSSPERVAFLLDSPVLNPRGVMNAARTWRDAWPAHLPAIASLYQRLQKRMADLGPTPFEGDPGPFDRPHEKSLAARLEPLRGRAWVCPIAAVEALSEMRADVEACLIDLPPIVSDDDVPMRQRLHLLARVMPLFVPLGTLKLPTPSTGDDLNPPNTGAGSTGQPVSSPERRPAE